MTTKRRAALLLALALCAPGLAACGGDGDDGTDAVASLDGDGGSGGDAEEAAGAGGTEDGGGGQGRQVSAEEQDALLEYAECMREHGIDMPDPEIDEDGGIQIRAEGPAPGGAGPGGADEEEFMAAEEACQPILDEAMPEVEIDPEEQAEMQDRLVEVAECMRERGYDMPDPEVDENGRVRIQMGPGANAPGGEGPSEDEMADMEECQAEAGMEGPRVVGEDGE